MNFTNLDLPLFVKTTKMDPISTFFVPVLRLADRYDIAVGYFSTAWIRDAAEGIAHFAYNGGKAHWIISPELSAEDYETLRDASGQLDEGKIDELVIRSFDRLFHALREDTRTVLAWLIRDGVMQFRIGVPQNKLSGMMHAKMGIFRDSQGHRIGFNGSYNLTSHAATNWETIDVYCSWRSQEARERITEISTDITAMWDGQDTNLAVFLPSDRALQSFIRQTECATRPYDFRTENSLRIAIPAHFLHKGALRPYQQEALRAWFRNNGHGILAMATGSGKTVTALAAVTRLATHTLEHANKLLVIITVPYQHLADQWAAEVSEFGFDPVVCYGGSRNWLFHAQQQLTELAAGASPIVLFVAVNNTFASTAFQRLITTVRHNVLLIADEMHNLGATIYRRVLPPNATFRLGLSATPIRHGDEQGTKSLEAYFGKTVFEFSLQEAIEHGFLCRYYYHPVLAPLNEEEMQEYKALSAEIARVFCEENTKEDGPSDRLQQLLIARARLTARVQNKLIQLQEILKFRRDSAYNLVYCGDAQDGDDKQINKVLHLIGQGLGMRARKFTSEEGAAERQELLESFGQGELQVLVAIRCLDEGVDVPRTETAYILASSTNPRQYIQRRGRVLRRAPGKDTATIYDFVTVPDLEELARTHPTALDAERHLVQRELERVNEFARLAINYGEALEQLREVKRRLHLMDL